MATLDDVFFFATFFVVFFAGATVLTFAFAGVAALTFAFAGVAALTMVAGVTEALGCEAMAASVAALVAVAVTSGVVGVELAANSAICEFQAKLEMIARNAEDETVAVAIRARRAGWGLRVNNLVIVLILAFVVIAFVVIKIGCGTCRSLSFCLLFLYRSLGWAGIRRGH